MSKHNRDRRKWRCARCRAGMHAELAGPAGRAMAAVARGSGRATDPRVAHVCGACKTFHYEDGGALRPLTPAELLALHVEVPNAMNQVAALKVPTSTTPAGTLIVARD